MVFLVLPFLALIWNGGAFADENREIASSEKLDLRPPMIWPAKQGTAMKVSSALQPSSKDIRESLHPMVDKFDWITPDRLLTPPEEIVGSMLGNTFLSNQTPTLELTTFELGISQGEVAPTPAMEEETRRTVKATPPIIGLAVLGFLAITDTPIRTVAVYIGIKVNGELFNYRRVSSAAGKAPATALSNALTASALPLATCLEAYIWRQRGQTVRPDTWRQCV